MKKRIEFDVDIDEFDLLRGLAKELHMEFALDDNTYYITTDLICQYLFEKIFAHKRFISCCFFL